MIRLTVRRVGCGPPLVLLPGWAMHSGVWGGLVEQLAPHFQLLLVDLPAVHHADAAPALIAALAEQVPTAGWLGWSLGGQLALQLAHRYPERVTALVLVASNPCFLAAPDWPGMAAAAFSDLERRVREDPVRGLRRFLALVAKGGPAARSLTRLWRQRPPPPLETLLAGLSWLRQWDLRALLPQLSCPSLWLGSEDDVLVPAAAMRAAARLSGGRWLEVTGGHAPFLTDPAAVAAAIRDALT